MKQQSPPGVFDILPNDSQNPWKSSYLWNYLESIIRKTAKDFGYQEIRTPIFEKTELFERSVGETSDIVSKEMYTFEDRGERMLSLRPEGTASVVRAYLENHLGAKGPVQKLFYIGPMFRYERAQAGRYRQFHQFGAEAIGISSPEQDVELIDLIYTLYQRLGLKDLTIQISSLGTQNSRALYRDALKNYLKSSFDQLSEDSKKRFDKNPLRILDSKDPNDRKILEGAPSILDYLDEDSKEHFSTVLQLLDQLKIPYVVNKEIVRGLDYYNHTVFEITSGDLGAQNTVGAGGRYDNLVKDLGGPMTPAIGFATGLERVLQVLLKQNCQTPSPDAPTLFLIPLGPEAKKMCFSLLHDLRKNGIAAEMDYTGKKLGKVMQYADSLKAKYTAVIGDNELKLEEVPLKEMETGQVTLVPLKNLTRILQITSYDDDYLEFFQEISRPFEGKQEMEFFLKRIGGSINQTTHLMQRLSKALETMKEII